MFFIGELCISSISIKNICTAIIIAVYLWGRNEIRTIKFRISWKS